MSSAIAALYARFGVAEGEAQGQRLDAAAWQRLLAANLDGFAFRQELVFLCESLANLEAQAQAVTDNAEANRRWAERVEAELDQAKTWSAKIEADIAVLNAEIAHRDGVVKELQAGVEWLRGELARSASDLERVTRERDELVPVQAAFDRLPRWVRHTILKRAKA
jgi:septal ring factor EnvC (AmiA/AmiB activator)